MIDLPLQEISISDFRRLEGHRTIPLDAPVVLLHGPNGTGKTSVLSAIEMALTGEIRSMRRHDDRYTAHLPSHGHSFATIRAIVADELLAGDPQRNMTVGGDRIDGRPALSAEAAQFFAERCYLDQVSLGQLLELYQYREGKKESALARFVNVLLGLDQLDALRSGLSETTDVRSMRKLSEGFSLAEANATQSDSRLRLVTGDLEAATADLERARSEMTQAMAALGYQELLRSDSPTLESDVEELLQPNDPSEQLRVIQPVSRQLMALGGRIEGLRTRPSAVRLRDVNATIASTEAAIEQWRITFESPIAIWHEEFAALQLGSPTDLAETLDDELRQIDARAANHADVAAEVELIALRIADQQATLDKVQADIAQAQQEAGSFASALAAVRDHVVSNACPVCDRDFDEVSSGHLVDHVDRKIAELTNVGRRLASLTDQRDSERAGLQADERLLAGMRAQLLSADTLAAAASRRTVVLRLRSRLDELRPAIAEGAALEAS